jgi:hypothetical protein
MPHLQTQLTYPPDLDSHYAYKRLFRPGRLTFGFIMPLGGAFMFVLRA